MMIDESAAFFRIVLENNDQFQKVFSMFLLISFLIQ